MSINIFIFEKSKWYIKSTCNDKISLLSLDGKQCFELGIKNNYVIVLSVNGNFAKEEGIFPGDFLVKIGSRNIIKKTLGYCCRTMLKKDESCLEFVRACPRRSGVSSTSEKIQRRRNGIGRNASQLVKKGIIRDRRKENTVTCGAIFTYTSKTIVKRLLRK
ncbi:MAG: hypothetical protein CML47_05545 [Rhodobacteraceae bacterium]|uniref:PDZ domain-containing protein n=1 Tax=viral metagenome TaxID=1070528 RepID=A0A6C0AV74_9ZZZZ|nr:MAG: hypothetical protein CML47_05545 [Paracoccaceae bacterium]|tara:strand:- start:4211 stop:4693 length:483 start_codon:yes stop_codon:yes gene_type:complete